MSTQRIKSILVGGHTVGLPGLLPMTTYDPERRTGKGVCLMKAGEQTCLAMGADLVIAVDVTRGLIGSPAVVTADPAKIRPRANPHRTETGEDRISDLFNNAINSVDPQALSPVHGRSSTMSAPNVFDVMGNTIRIIETELSTMLLERSPPDILIQPPVGQINFMEFHRAREAIDAGYEAARQQLTEQIDTLTRRNEIEPVKGRSSRALPSIHKSKSRLHAMPTGSRSGPTSL